MTIDEKRIHLKEMCDQCLGCDECPLAGSGASCEFDEMAVYEVERLYELSFIPKPNIKDSGERREFPTGAVRDIQEGKGRCDLLPLDVVGEFLGGNTEKIFRELADFQHTGSVSTLFVVLALIESIDPFSMMLEVAIHFEQGCQKYGENNWQKGIPTHCYIDSAVRHYLKWLRGDKDEPHERAFVWNIMCCIWTCINKPELNDYRKAGDA